MLCHALDFDDTHTDSVCHVSAAVAPAAFAVAEASRVSGAQLVTALVVGNELVTRLGMAATARFHARGFHPTSVCGVFGATAAAARLVRFGPRETVRALGIAGSFASGIFEYLGDGSETKPIHAARAAEGGVTAVELTANGAGGPRGVFEGRFGLYATFADLHGIELGPSFADLGRRWETPRIAFKPYPACHYVHAAIDAVAAAARDAAPEAIREIHVEVPEAAVALVLEPTADKHRPRTPYDAKFSLPFAVATRLVRGRVDVASFSADAIADPAVLALAARVSYEIRTFASFPAAFPANVVVRFADSDERRAEMLHQRGGVENPLTDDDVRDKFRANAALALDAADAEALERGILALDEAADLTAVGGLLRRAQPRGRS
jgi:2-methylcitrate dehydratase PrpD